MLNYAIQSFEHEKENSYVIRSKYTLLLFLSFVAVSACLSCSAQDYRAECKGVVTHDRELPCKHKEGVIFGATVLVEQ